MNSKETFGDSIRNLREKVGLPLRKVSAELDIDPSTLSKIERGGRAATRKMVPVIARIFDVDEKELLIIYFSDKVAYELMEEDDFDRILKVVEGKIRYFKNKKLT
jgi:transcriptional regulator with XRE-family HTH domain